MAIIGPPDLPKVLKADSNPLKLRILHALGHPVVNVELTEGQLEDLLRYTGDFISTYLPLQERYAYFYTQPLVTTYDLPKDAHWVREVAFDSVTNKINDIFSAEMFLFCVNSDNCSILTNNGLKHHSELDENDKLVTPFGLEDYSIEFHEVKQPLVKIVYNCGSIECTPNQPIKINGFDIEDSLEGWFNASDLKVGDKLVLRHGLTEIISIEDREPNSTVTIKTGSGCFYSCCEGDPIVIH